MICEATRAVCQNALDGHEQGQLALYQSALQRGQRGQIWSSLTGRSRRLLSLEEVSEACTVQARSSAGTRTVAIDQICGSENRAADFDCSFNPLQDHTHERWLGIASAVQRGRTLPPVALIQVGDSFFVRDGHHRISVARALGQAAIEATIEVWQVDQPLPWEQRSQAASQKCTHNHGAARPAPILGWLSGLLRLASRATASQTAG